MRRANQISKIRAIIVPLIEELRSLDRNFRVFGTRRQFFRWRRYRGHGHCYRFNRTISDSAVESLERRLGHKLPDDYREFITQIGDGGAGPNYGLKPIADAVCSVDLATPFPWSSEVVRMTDSEENLWASKPGVLEISEWGCGGADFLVVNGSARGSVWGDFSTEGLPLSPTNESFLDWYVDWAKRCIETIRREPLIAQIRIGMSVDEVRTILGTDICDKWVVDDRFPDAVSLISFTNTNASFEIGPDRKVKKINQWDHV